MPNVCCACSAFAVELARGAPSSQGDARARDETEDEAAQEAVWENVVVGCFRMCWERCRGDYEKTATELASEHTLLAGEARTEFPRRP